MWWSRVEGWRLLRASDLFKVLNKVAGRVSDRVFVSRKCNWASGVYFMWVRGGTPVSAIKAVWLT